MMTSWIEHITQRTQQFLGLWLNKITWWRAFLHKLYTTPTSISKRHPHFRSTFIALATLVYVMYPIAFVKLITLAHARNFAYSVVAFCPANRVSPVSGIFISVWLECTILERLRAWTYFEIPPEVLVYLTTHLVVCRKWQSCLGQINRAPPRTYLPIVSRCILSKGKHIILQNA